VRQPLEGYVEASDFTHHSIVASAMSVHIATILLRMRVRTIADSLRKESVEHSRLRQM
jgi:hypothetical protein